MNEQPQGVDGGDLLKVAGKLSNWKTYLIYGLLAVVALEGIGLIWQRGTVAKYKNDVLKAEQATKDMMVERDIAKANENSCRVNLDNQNTQIGDAGKRYDDLQRRFDELQRKIDNGNFYKPGEDVKKQPTPKTCQEALDFMNRNLP